MMKKSIRLSALVIIFAIFILFITACSAGNLVGKKDTTYKGQLKEVTLKFLFPGAKNLQVDNVIDKIEMSAKSELNINLEFEWLGTKRLDDVDFHNAYSLSLSDSDARIIKTIDNILNLLGRFISSLAIITTIGILDLLCLNFVLISVVLYFIFKNKSSKLRFLLTQKNTVYNRIKNYIAQAFIQKKFAKEIKITEISKVFFSMYSKSTQQIINNLKKVSKKIALIRTIQNNSVNIFSFFATVLYLSYMVIYNNMSLGIFIILVNATVQLSHKLMEVFFNVTDITENSLYIENLRKFLNYKPFFHESDTGLSKDNFHRDITFFNVCYRYKNATCTAISGINCTISKGEKIALVGFNGAGKSTSS